MYKREDGDRPVEHSPRGRYIRFDIRLGTGAYKTVYKAYDTDQGIDVAWNAIDIGVLPSTEKNRIIQEVQLLQKLEHKNIINFYGSWFSKEKNQVVFITEIMTSGTLKSYIKRVQFVKWKIIKRWCIQILEGLHYLHSQHPPVIHRDLKCDNIFINGNTGDLRIGDLGLSTQLAVHSRAAQSVLGTPEFMAPELYDESYDEKVDIYAFGMCVLEMVTKEVPYSECINPAQIYKKVTAGIRPKGLQRVLSQAAKDFIELCLSRGNGEIDVSAEYLLDHPFLKAQEDDGDMVECLKEDELEREVKQEQERLAHVSEESMASELNMESASKGSDQSNVTDRRKMFPSLSSEPEAIASGSSSTVNSTTNGAAARAALPGLESGEVRYETPAEEKSAGKHQMVSLPSVVKPEGDATAPSPAPPPPPLQTDVSAPEPTPVPSSAPAPTPAEVPAPIVSAPDIDEPFSGKKDVDTHVDNFLATMPATEIRIQNTRMNVMGGRGHRLELEDTQEQQDDEEIDKAPEPEVDAQTVPSLVTTDNAVPVNAPTPTLEVQIPVAQAPAAVSTPLPSPPITNSVPVDFGHAATSQSMVQSEGPVPTPASLATAAVENSSVRVNSRPHSASSSVSSTTAGMQHRKRGKRHEIKAVKDPDHDHSILLNLRLMIDGKSKEIKFPFNLFTDSSHEVACELAVDVGILEPDLEDIADSIAFLVTEGKINNVSDVSEDVWEEAPEPHSFSSKPLPHVSKMSFLSVSGSQVLQPAVQQTPPPQQVVPNIVIPTATLDRPQGSTPKLGPSDLSLNEPPANITASAPVMAVAAAQPSGIHAPNNATPGTQAGPSVDQPTTLQEPATRTELPPSLVVDTSHHASLHSHSAVFVSHGKSPSHAAQFVHSQSDLLLNDEPPVKPELRDRGMSIGSLSDAGYMTKVQNFEDRMKVARSAFDERESTLEAAIRSEEEKHQREIERFRKKMQEFEEKKQRAALARQERMKQVADELRSEADLTQTVIPAEEALYTPLPAVVPSSVPIPAQLSAPVAIPTAIYAATTPSATNGLDQFGRSPGRVESMGYAVPVTRNINEDTSLSSGQFAVSYGAGGES